jgi:hypothetical protein
MCKKASEKSGVKTSGKPAKFHFGGRYLQIV